MACAFQDDDCHIDFEGESSNETDQSVPRQQQQGQRKDWSWPWFDYIGARRRLQSLNNTLRRFSDDESNTRREIFRQVVHSTAVEGVNMQRRASTCGRATSPLSGVRADSDPFAPLLSLAQSNGRKSSTGTQAPPEVVITSAGGERVQTVDLLGRRLTLDSRACADCYDQLQDLKRQFRLSRTHKEKYEILTCIPSSLVSDEDLPKEFCCSETMAYTAAALRISKGCFSSPAPQFSEHIPEFAKLAIITFCEESENGGELKGREHCVEQMSETRSLRVQKRAMFASLSEMYQEYIFIFPGHRRYLTLSKFAYSIPHHVMWSKPFTGNGHENTCLVHENLQLLLSACTTYYSDGVTRLLANIVCSDQDPFCMLGYCDKCPVPGSIKLLTIDYKWEDHIEFHLWQQKSVEEQQIDHSNRSNELALVQITEPFPQFTIRLETHIRTFLKHHFIQISQKEYLQHLNACMSRDKSIALVKMDFCEPYTVVSKVGSKKSKLVSFDPQRCVPIHPFCIKYYDEGKGSIEERCIIVVSNDQRESATTSFLFRAEMIKWVKHALPHIKTITYFSDDNKDHYRNAENILNLLYHEEDFKLRATHEFTLEGHDSSECSTVVTSVKRQCRLASLSGNAVITTPEEMFKYCKKELTRYDLQFAFMDRSVGRIRNMEITLQRRYKLNNGIIPGISHFYSFRPHYPRDGGCNDVIRVRRYSLSRDYKDIKVLISSSTISTMDDFHFPTVSSSTSPPYDENNLFPGNTVTVSLEGIIFTGRIDNDATVRLGNIQVTLLTKIEMDKRGRPIHVQLEEEKQVWISTLDVTMVDDVVTFTKKKGWSTGAANAFQQHQAKRQFQWSAGIFFGGGITSPRRILASIRRSSSGTASEDEESKQVSAGRRKFSCT